MAARFIATGRSWGQSEPATWAGGPRALRGAVGGGISVGGVTTVGDGKTAQVRLKPVDDDQKLSLTQAIKAKFGQGVTESQFALVGPAAAVVFAREVDGRTKKDPRVKELEAAVKAAATDGERVSRRAALADVIKTVRSEKLGEVADQFDRIHSVHRALEVGSLDRIISAAELRPYLIDAIERGMAREMERWQACTPPLR